MGTNVDPVCWDDKSYLEKIAGGGVTPRYLGTYQTLAALKADWPDSMGASMKDSWAMVAGTQYTYTPGVGWVAQNGEFQPVSAMESFCYLPEWVAATAYYIGTMVKNNGNVWVCQASGTSGGAFPSATPVYAYITDGTAKWGYLRSAKIVDCGVASTAAEYTLPTTTATQTLREAGLTGPTFGGITEPPRGWKTGGTWGGLIGPSEASSWRWRTNALTLKFAFTNYGFQAPAIYIEHQDGSLHRAAINMRNDATGSGKVFVINFAERAFRNIVMQMPANAYHFFGIAHDKYATFQYTKNYRKTWLLFGDSFTGGSAYHPTSLSCSIASAISRTVGVDVFVNSVGGSGYVAGSKFYARLVAADLADVDVVAFAGGINDTYSGQFVAEVNACASYVASKGKRLVMFGAFWGPGAPSQATTKDVAISAAALGNGGYFIPVATAIEPVMTGTGNVGAPANDGTADILRAPAPDALHPMMLGSLFIGEGMGNEAVRMGLANI